MPLGQDQSASGGAFAVQAGGDVTINGLSALEVRALCQQYLQDNFPRLREQARDEAERQVKHFGDLLSKRLVDDASSIVMEKLAKPSVQASINDAVMAVARKGENGSPEVLSRLIVENLKSGTSQFLDLVVSEAIQVVPKLGPQQINLLAFCWYVTAVRRSTAPDLQWYRQSGELVLNLCRGAFGLSRSQKEHLQYAGAASFLDFFSGNAFEDLRQQEPFDAMKFADQNAFRQTLMARAPAYFVLLEQFNKDGLASLRLTSVGQAIALTQLKTVLPEIELRHWIK